MTIRFQIPVYLSDRVSASFDSKKKWYYVKNEQQYGVELHFRGENSKTQKTGKKLKKHKKKETQK